MLDGAHAALAEPFRGIAAGTEIVPGLFARKRTGVSLAPLVEAARSFLATLTPKQRKAACFPIDAEAWRSWSNIHPWLMRHGVCLADLNGNQREYALALLRGRKQRLEPFAALRWQLVVSDPRRPRAR
jgi:hypothetical protein